MFVEYSDFVFKTELAKLAFVIVFYEIKFAKSLGLIAFVEN